MPRRLDDDVHPEPRCCGLSLLLRLPLLLRVGLPIGRVDVRPASVRGVRVRQGRSHVPGLAVARSHHIQQAGEPVVDLSPLAILFASSIRTWFIW